MVSLDVGIGEEGSPEAYECQHCNTTLVASQEPDDLTCCGDPMVPIEGEEAVLNEPDLDTILRDIFGLSRNAIVICIVVIERGPMTVADVANVVGLSESTVSSTLDDLVEVGILERSRRNLKTGGTVNVYETAPFERQQRLYRRGLFRWVSESIERIAEFDIEGLKAQYRREEPTDEDRDESAIYWDTESGAASTD